MSVRERLRGICASHEDSKPCFGCTEVTEHEWLAAGDSDAKRTKKLLNEAIIACQGGCDCVGAPRLIEKDGRRCLGVKCGKVTSGQGREIEKCCDALLADR